jgi:hypothetical protein
MISCFTITDALITNGLIGGNETRDENEDV